MGGYREFRRRLAPAGRRKREPQVSAYTSRFFRYHLTENLVFAFRKKVSHAKLGRSYS